MDLRFCELQDDEVEQEGEYAGGRRCLKFKYSAPNMVTYCPFSMMDIDVQSSTKQLYVSPGDDASDRCVDFKLVDSVADIVLIGVIDRASNKTKLKASKKLFKDRCKDMTSKPTSWRLEEQISEK